MSVSTPPVFSDTVNQDFFIESQGGSQHPVSYLDRFPDSVYTKGIDSVLVTLAYALLGPAGAGYLREQYLEARLQFEDAGLSTTDLDALYSHPFAFARAALETYSTDASASLLSSQQRAEILASDAAFRNRAVTWFKAIRAGGTRQGLTLAAQSALNHPVELIENYRALYDQYGDIPLGLPFMGTTTNLNEIIVLPRQDVPTNAQQTISISGEPSSGWFSLTVPLGPNYQKMAVGATNGSSTYTVPNAAQTPLGTYFTITGGSSTAYGQVSAILSPTSVSVVWAPQVVNAGLPLTWTDSTGTYQTYVGNAQTSLLPYNATYAQIQAALWALPLIGNNDVTVMGGPLPDRPVIISFANKLADRPIPAIQFNLAPDTPTGVGNTTSSPPLVPQLADITGNALNIAGNVTVDQVGVSADSQAATIPPADEHAMEIALDAIRPVTSFVTTVQAQGVTTRQPANTVFAGQTYTEVVRYETGQASIAWQSDPLHWIQGGVEREAPRPVGDLSHHYQGFHNVVSARAYTEGALQDSGYQNGSTDVGSVYWDTKIGKFSPAQVALYPFLTRYQDDNARYPAGQAVAVSPEPLIITDTVNGTGVINSLYPADYLSLSGLPQLPTTSTFWASGERIVPPAGSAIDYLEIDLGTVQAVNYLYFEATNKPYTIDVAYDILDQSPARFFAPVTLQDPSFGPSTTVLIYDTSVTNPWTTVEIHFANTLNQMIYTRYLRIGFTRSAGNNPFTPIGQPPVPYSIEVRNLRVGRNVATDTERTLAISRIMGNTYWPAIYPDPTLYPGSTVIPS